MWHTEKHTERSVILSMSDSPMIRRRPDVETRDAAPGHGHGVRGNLAFIAFRGDPDSCR